MDWDDSDLNWELTYEEGLLEIEKFYGPTPKTTPEPMAATPGERASDGNKAAPPLSAGKSSQPSSAGKMSLVAEMREEDEYALEDFDDSTSESESAGKDDNGESSGNRLGSSATSSKNLSRDLQVAAEELSRVTEAQEDASQTEAQVEDATIEAGGETGDVNMEDQDLSDTEASESAQQKPEGSDADSKLAANNSHTMQPELSSEDELASDAPDMLPVRRDSAQVSSKETTTDMKGQSSTEEKDEEGSSIAVKIKKTNESEQIEEKMEDFKITEPPKKRKRPTKAEIEAAKSKKSTSPEQQDQPRRKKPTATAAKPADAETTSQPQLKRKRLSKDEADTAKPITKRAKPAATTQSKGKEPATAGLRRSKRGAAVDDGDALPTGGAVGAKEMKGLKMPEGWMAEAETGKRGRGRK